MIQIKRQIVTDESMQPVAVLIDYADWEKIERLLAEKTDVTANGSLEKHRGILDLTEDPLEYQQRVRREW
ncbi:MAG: hypothetical protein O2999_09980 [Nitrospirae bacterium]|nr:hypothetical protein [Nitrospirota bacterium]MDA1304610.1 hypothetical protein [Nitrospirota bacterium]